MWFHSKIHQFLNIDLGGLGIGYSCPKIRFFELFKVRDKTNCAVFIWDEKCRRTPLGAVDFLDDIKGIESIKFLFEREFMYAWNR